MKWSASGLSVVDPGPVSLETTKFTWMWNTVSRSPHLNSVTGWR